MIWEGLYFSNTGYAEATRRYVLALDDLGIPVTVRPTDSLAGRYRIRREELEQIHALAFREPQKGDLRVQHARPPTFTQDHGACANVGYTVFETDRLPRHWVGACNEMDEIWVPSRFCVESFLAAGVSPAKLQVIPHGVDANRFGPHVPALEIDGAQGFIFLSVFRWSKRKGWDVLLRAYLSEFHADEEVCLVIRASGLSQAELADFVASEFGRGSRPTVVLLPFTIPDALLPSLYAAADAFAVPARGEGWGMPYSEAMITGLPTIATNWGGHLEYMSNENAYLVEAEGLVPIDEEMQQATEAEPYHHWAEPSVDHLRQLMRWVFEHREEASSKGLAAREYMTRNFTWQHAALRICERAKSLTGLRSPGQASKPSVERSFW